MENAFAGKAPRKRDYRWPDQPAVYTKIRRCPSCGKHRWMWATELESELCAECVGRVRRAEINEDGSTVTPGTSRLSNSLDDARSIENTGDKRLWDAFIYWARRFREDPEFDAKERHFKLEIAERVILARTTLVSGGAWWERLRKSFSSPNNLTPWQLHDKYLKWAKDNSLEAAAGLQAAWDRSRDVSRRIDDFCRQLPKEVAAGNGLRTALAAFLQAGIDVFRNPIYRSTPALAGFALVGYPPPPPGSSEGTMYSHFLGFLDSFIQEGSKRELKLRDRLDAQSLTFLLTKAPPLETWSQEDAEMFRQFQGKSAEATSDLAQLVEQFRDEEGYPDERDARKLAEREELAAALTPEALKEPDPAAIRRMGGPAFGSPGPQSSFMAAMGNEDGLERIAGALSHLLYGDGEVSDRFDEVLEGRHAIPGLKEALLTKALAIAYPEEWLPTYVTRGAKGKRTMLLKLGLRPDGGARTAGQLAASTNSKLRDALQPYFQTDTWGMMRFLFWLLGREEKSDAEPLGVLAEKLLIGTEHLLKIERLLIDKKQVIFYGPPGTGKTYVARELARVFSVGGEMKKIQFHPSYAYEDFVEGYRPQPINGQPGFKLMDGPLKQIVTAANGDLEDRYVLLIDEINRGNIAKIFGELYYLLEYRDEEINLQYSSEPFALPPNLWIIGTMNSADRSIAMVDSALRRRFHFVPFFPDKPPVEGLLGRWLERNHPSLVWVADVVERANQLLGDRHMAIGPSHFMRKELSEEWIELIWEYSILPYIEEQYFGEEGRLDEFQLDRLKLPLPGSSLPGNDDESPNSSPGI